ncbi:MAG: TlpA family protein disulfide reductase [Chitinophagaceae bacterium]|nr:MAG: TlpA family protein disulfide reductase [Chitinophagaceae bacterium]
MRKIEFYLLTLFIATGCRNNNAPIPFIIKGEVNIPAGEIVRLDKLIAVHEQPLASCIVTNHQFILKGSVPSEGIYLLGIYNVKYYDTMLKRQASTVLGDEVYIQKNATYFFKSGNGGEVLYDNKQRIISSSVPEQVLAMYLKEHHDLFDSLQRVKSILINKMNQADDAYNSKLFNLYADSISRFDRINQDIYFHFTENFCYAHTNSIITPWIILNRGGYLADQYFSTWNKLYGLLSKNVRRSSYGESLKEALRRMGRLTYGSKAPSIRGETLDGQNFRFDYSQHRLTMIDFWASWCAPCMEEMSTLKKLYTLYHNKGFDIIGVSFDKSQADWLSAVRKDTLLWNQVYNPDESKNGENAESFDVHFIPKNYFINNKGLIVAKEIQADSLADFVSNYLNL